MLRIRFLSQELREVMRHFNGVCVGQVAGSEMHHLSFISGYTVENGLKRKRVKQDLITKQN